MTNYKDTFQLAQDKGYEAQFTNVDTSEKYFAAPKEWQLLELTLIQKWLRDEYKIMVQPMYVFHRTDEGLPPFNVGKIPNSHTSYIATGENIWCDTYEQALLEGIHEALKLLP